MISGLIKTMNVVKNQIKVDHADLKQEISNNTTSIEQLKKKHAKKKRGEDPRNGAIKKQNKIR